MAGIIHTTVPTRITRRRLVTGSLGVFAGVTASRVVLAQSDDSATPGTADRAAGGPERMYSLLSLVPERLGVQASANGVVFYYADLLRQLESLEIESFDPEANELPVGFNGALIVLATASVAYQYGLEPEFVSTFGFSALQAEESLSIGTPPNDLTIFRGGLPIEDLPDIWQASGYALETTASGAEVWTAGREGEVELTSSVSKYGIGALNNVAIIGDTVVFGRFFTDVESVVAHVESGGASVADGSGLADVLATMAEDTVSAVAVTGDFLNLQSLTLPDQVLGMEPMFEESAEQAGDFPVPEIAVFSITAGAKAADFVATGEGTPAPEPEVDPAETDGGVVQVRLLCDSNEAAATAVAAIEYRWNTWDSLRISAPFTELMTVITAEPIDLVAAVDFREVSRSGVWIDLVLSRDLTPFSWIGDLPVEASPTAAG